MKIKFAEKVVATSHEFESAQCTIDAEDMRYIASLLRNNYSDSILATIREIFANAVDANAENGLDNSSIIVNLPTSLDPTFSIRDFGAGLSRDQMFNLYTKYGKSTKRDNDSGIGGFGIGRLAPLSYRPDGFTITSFVDGDKRIYSLYIDEQNDTKLTEIHSESTEEANGVLISVGIKSDDINSFQATANSFFKYFDKLPVLNRLRSPIVQPDTIIGNDEWKIVNNNNNYYSSDKIVMGGINYPLDLRSTAIKLPQDLQWVVYLNNLVLYAPIGSVALHHSREALEYNKRTADYIVSRLKRVQSDLQELIKDKFKNIECLAEAKEAWCKLKNNLPAPIINGLSHINLYKGYALDSVFNRTYYEENSQSKRIPVSFRNFEKKSSGDIRNRKCYQATVSSRNCMVFHDLPPSSVITNRIYSLFDTYETVTVVNHDNSISGSTDGVKLYKKHNGIDLVKNHIFNLSDLEQVKVPKKNKLTSVSYNATYFFTIGDTYGGLHKANQSEIENIELVKPYIEIKNRAAVDNSLDSNNRYDNSFRSQFFKPFEEVFGVKCYGVSVAVSKSKKFENQTDFVKVEDYIKSYWENLHPSDKDKVLEFFKYYVDKNNDSWFNLKQVSQNDCLPKIKKLSDKKAEVEKALNKKLKDFAMFIIDNIYFDDCLVELKPLFDQKNMNEDKGYRTCDIVVEAVAEAYKEFPVLKHLDVSISYNWKSGVDKAQIAKDFATAVK